MNMLKPKTTAERQRAFKARRTSQGLREVREFGIWVTNSQWQEIRAFARQLAGKGKPEN